jgi:hypothetical protein
MVANIPDKHKTKMCFQTCLLSKLSKESGFVEGGKLPVLNAHTDLVGRAIPFEVLDLRHCFVFTVYGTTRGCDIEGFGQSQIY